MCNRKTSIFLTLALSLPLILSGCNLLPKDNADKATTANAVIAADNNGLENMLAFAAELAATPDVEWQDLGDVLLARINREPSARQRIEYALWLATPDRDTYNPGKASQHLQYVAQNESMPTAYRDFAQFQSLQLGYRQQAISPARRAIKDCHQQLTKTLTKLQALTDLEQRFSSDISADDAP